ncbi:LysE family translocator [Bordetella genomosp. 13]|uniref:Lysine transporter LysE n=1 Tax=Bordetella genomosp. 13 TaxID=463040 RepID=A0A1W6ZC45_9BORD|nr:LysE family translocator [Bordetella genomosp. 13]ARP94434.1 lysine transporter LysE [Bordetella genomosp. 13]
MPEPTTLFTFALLALGLVLTPGPNMIYLVSRSLSQGRRAGLVSVCGVGLGATFYVLCTAFGLTALLLSVPYAYDALRIGGAAYLLYLAWQSLRSGGHSPFEVRQLPPSSRRQLFGMGLLTSLLNPKVAMFYLSLLPQFIDPERGSVLTQALALGFTQVVISVCVNGLLAVTAGTISGFLARNPLWLAAQRWFMGLVLAGLAVRLALDSRR